MLNFTKRHKLLKIINYRICLTILLSLGTAFFALGQNNDCKKCLAYAHDVLSSPDGEDGRFELLPDTLQVCLDKEKGASREQKQEALLLLTEAYIFMKREADADTSYLKVLKKNPIYDPEAEGEIRPIELIQHAKKFRSTPLFSVELKVGATAPILRILERYDTDNYTLPPPKKYSLGTGLQGGFLATYHPSKLINVSTGLFYSNRLYNYRKQTSYYDNGLDVPPSNTPLVLDLQESQGWLDIPLMVRFNFSNKKFIPFYYIGGEFNYLLSAVYTEISLGTSKKNEHKLNGGILPLRNTTNISFITGFGTRMKLGPHFLVFDLKYGFMTQNVVVLENLYSDTELIYEYKHVDDHFQFHNVSFTIGYQRAFYKAKKLKH